jgi:hypothetical protein
VNTTELHVHTEQVLEALRREFTGKVPADAVTEIGRARLDALLAVATINDFVPLLVYRQTREALLSIGPEDLHRAA